MTVVRNTRPAAEPPFRVAMRFAWLLVAVVVIGDRLHGDVAAAILLAVAAAAWLGWMAARRTGQARWATLALVVVGCASGALALHDSVAVGFLAAVAVAGASTYELRPAAAIAACGPVMVTGLTLANGRAWGIAIAGAAIALAGFAGGVTRRQAEALVVASERANVLAERNRIAREVHDVLAHTLGAVAVQLEAASAVHEDGGSAERLSELLARSRQLVSEGLNETSRAVRALRDEPVELDAQLAALIEGEQVELEVRGEPRALRPDAGVALYRAAQEAITNIRKHAPGAATRVVLDFRPDATVLTVANGPAASAPGPTTGSGFGLQGMRERIELAGGRLDAGASQAGWTVEATVPA